MGLESIIKRLNDGPAVLFVGQNYLSIETGKDPVLTKVFEKYSASETLVAEQSYSAILKLGLSLDAISFYQWLQGLSKSISLPGWLAYIGQYRWASVYTTAYDTVLERAFMNEMRTVQPIVNERYIVNDPRNKNHLHISYLYGNIATIDIGDKPPLTAVELFKRKTVAGALLNRLPSIVSPKGVLVIEGYNVSDQLPFEDLLGYISHLGKDQVLLCSASEQILSNEILIDLIDSGIVYATKTSFAELLSKWESDGILNGRIEDSDENYGRWLTIAGERVRLPDDIHSKVSKFAFIPDDSTFVVSDDESEDERYKNFRKFLASSNITPDWIGYGKGFAFKRDYYQELKLSVLGVYESKERLEAPIILAGQTSSGKTISLGQLVYDLRVESEIPVLFIPKRYQRVDEYTIDRFCTWAEQFKAKSTVIVWDGMLELEAYYSLLRFLSRRGRNVLIVCSSYKTSNLHSDSDVRKFIESPIELQSNERERFVDFLNKVNENLGRAIKTLEEPNLLALLYRHLPADPSKIISGVHDEYRFFINLLRSLSNPEKENKTTFYEALSALGFTPTEQDEKLLNDVFFVDKETMTIADFLIFSVMIAGQYGLNVPFELLLDAVGFDAFGSHIFNALTQVNLIKWIEDESGNIDLGPRTTLEAEILSRYAGGKRAEVSYIIALIKGIHTDIGADFGSFHRQVDFAVKLLNEIGPNSEETFKDFYYEITVILKRLRTSRQAYHPRLVLQEAFFLRSIVKSRRDLVDINESNLELLLRAESIVTAALEEMGSESERLIASYLRVELSTICGYLSSEYLSLGEKEIAREYYYEVKRINNFSFSTNPGNYRALAIAFWTTEKMIDAKVFDDEEKIDAQVDLSSLIEMVDAEGVSNEHLQEFDVLKMKFFELIGKNEIAEELFQKMRVKGYTAGIYYKAKSIVGFHDESIGLTKAYIEKNASVLKYLLEYIEEIKTDGRCLFLLLKSWWIEKTQNSFFGAEKQSLAFSDKDWDFCLHITDLLIVNADKFISATVYYIRAIAQFQIGEIKDSIGTFRDLQDQSFKGAYGRRRITRFYIYSTNRGYPKEFEGEVTESVSRNKNEKRGEIYVPELDINVPFFLGDFGQSNFQKGDIIRRFHIAFNFLGPIATPLKN